MAMHSLNVSLGGNKFLFDISRDHFITYITGFFISHHIFCILHPDIFLEDYLNY